MSPYPKRKQVVETLVRKGAHLNDKNKELLTPLHIATDLSHYDLMDTLLRLGAKVNALDALGQTGQAKCFTPTVFLYVFLFVCLKNSIYIFSGSLY